MFTPLPDSVAGDSATWPISRDLAGLRELVSRHAEQAGLSPQCAGDLALAANEAVTNVLDHAGGRGWVRIWADDGFLTVEVIDLAGRLGPGAGLDEPPKAGPRGYGLWVMRRLCDDLVITQKSGSSQVRLRMRRPRPAGTP